VRLIARHRRHVSINALVCFVEYAVLNAKCKRSSANNDAFYRICTQLEFFGRDFEVELQIQGGATLAPISSTYCRHCAAGPLTSIASLNANELQTTQHQGQFEGLHTLQARHCDEISFKASGHDFDSLLTAHSRWV